MQCPRPKTKWTCGTPGLLDPDEVAATLDTRRIVLEHAHRRRAQQAATRLLQAAETGPLTALHNLVEDEHAALSERTTAPPRACRSRWPAPLGASPPPPTPHRHALTRPDRTAVAAVVVTACALLAAHVTALHRGLRTALFTRLAGIGTLRDRDGLLLLNRQDATGNTGPATTTIYLGTDLDDVDVWAHVVKLRARQVLVLPDQDSQLVALLAAHLGATA